MSSCVAVCLAYLSTHIMSNANPMGCFSNHLTRLADGSIFLECAAYIASFQRDLRGYISHLVPFWADASAVVARMSGQNRIGNGSR